MSGLEWIGLTLAFLAPVAPERPRRPEPEPLRGNEWAAAVVIGGVFLMMVGPMIVIWSFHRPHEAFRARCEAAGGHVPPRTLDGGGFVRCDHDGAAAPAGPRRN